MVTLPKDTLISKPPEHVSMTLFEEKVLCGCVKNLGVKRPSWITQVGPKSSGKGPYKRRAGKIVSIDLKR